MAQTTTPKKAGMTVARNGNNIVLTWTPIKNCTDQDLKVYVNNKLVGNPHDLGSSTKKYTYTINRSNWYPNQNNDGSYKKKLTEVAFKLARKQSGKTESSYSDQKEFKIKVPGKPEYKLPQIGNSNTNEFTYSWERNSNDGDIKTTHKMFTHFHWETCLVNEGEDADWSLADTQKITRIRSSDHQPLTNQDSKGNFTNTDPHEVIIRENMADIEAKKRRFFRVRSVGPAGYSEYRESSHHLGGYTQVSVPSENTSYIGSDATGTSGSINLINTNTEGEITDLGTGYPDDSIQVQYGITPPKVIVTTENGVVKSSLALPDGFNSWSTLDTFASTGVPDQYTFKIPEPLTDNNVLFIRVNRIHDNITTYGVPTLMNNKKIDGENTLYIGILSSPTLDGINISENTKNVTVNATNTSDINGSFIAVYQSIEGKGEKVIGVLTSNQSSGTFPGDWADTDDPSFGIRCYIGDYSPATRQPSGVTVYDVDSNVLMASNGIIWQPDLVSKPPIIKQLTKYDNTTAYISWDWTWDQADSAEITWSNNKMAWESTEEPSSYILTNTRNGWRYITGLSAGTYYFKVRFIRTSGDTVTYGKYSEIAELLMAEGPTTPALTVSDEDGIVGPNEEVTVYWKYQSNDGTPQSLAILGETQNESAPWTYVEKKRVNTDECITFTPEEFGWEEGTTHKVGISLMSGSGKPSKDGWSEPVSITVARKPEISITNLIAIEPVSGDADEYPYKLTQLPIEFTASGFGGDGYCSVAIERDGSYNIERPDDTSLIGYDGETIFAGTFYPEDEDSVSVPISIYKDDLIGRLDDTARYKMLVTITDKYGQTDYAEYPFTVAWDHHAQMPEATIIIDANNDIARITPIAPNIQNVDEGDYCQIYRMSADKPQLILDNGEFGTEYVDIYPTYGRFGGYKIVYVTKYGDYKTQDNVLAMTEYSKSGNDQDIDQYDKFLVSIQFDDNLVEFPGNISLNHSWVKDFQTTKYLGGSIQGDWNPGIQRTGTINGTIPIEYEAETMYGLRILADHAGICHIRTPEGSNFYGDIQVRDDREEKWVNRVSKISLTYTKVDSIEDDLMTYAEWQARQE